MCARDAIGSAQGRHVASQRPPVGFGEDHRTVATLPKSIKVVESVDGGRFVPKSVALLADDLSRALDAAAPFAGRNPVGVIPAVWTVDSARGRSAPLAQSTETRAYSPSKAKQRVGTAVISLPDADIRFKKIDSLVRGNTADEIATCAACDRFATILVAPAFPAQGRLVVDGRVVAGKNFVDLAAQLRDRGVRVATPAQYADMTRMSGVVLCDAQTDDDLRRIASMSDHMPGPLLHCGSGGLSSALAPPFQPVANVPLPDLVVIGSQTEVSRRHLARLADQRPSAVAIRSTPDAWQTHVDWASPRLTVSFAMPRLSPHVAERAVRAALKDLVRHRVRPKALFVVGGDTLRRLLEAAGATSVGVHGAWSPGVAVSRVTDGAWQGPGCIRCPVPSTMQA